MTEPRAYRVIRDIPERASLLPQIAGGRPALPTGTIVHEYRGVTYGCLTEDETAISLEPDETPFHGVPTAALEEILPCEACGERPGTYDGGLCDPCYWAAVDLELSCDWLPDEEATQ